MTAINDLGQVTGGGANSQGSDQAFIATTSGGTAIPMPPDSSTTFGYAINDSGQVTGYVNGATHQAFIGTTAGSTVIPSLSGLSLTYCCGINDSGQVVGNGYNAGTAETFVGTTSGSTAIPVPNNWLSVQGYAINDSGQVAGFGSTGSKTQAFIGTTSGSTAIPLPSASWQIAYGYGINDSGQVAGWGFSGSRYQAFIGTTSGSTAIPLPAGATYAETHSTSGSINDSGYVVGFSDPGGWIWDAADGTELLNTIVPTGWNISEAIAISDTGLILALGSYNGGSTEYVELSANAAPTPEPGTMFLACAGLLLIAAERMRFVGAQA